MGRDHYIWQRQQRIVKWDWLGVSYVKRGPRYPAGACGFIEGAGVNGRTSGCVDEERVRLHQVELTLPYDVLSFGG
jgi:hypothetical protein